MENPLTMIRQLLEDHMVDIPKGSFEMGDLTGNGESNEKPVHSVKVPAFKMGKTTVTFEIYDQYLQATNQQPSEEEKGHANDQGWGRDDRPVINVSWEEAQEFIQWLNETLQPEKPYRLPSESEWEYAARAGTETDYWWGNEIGTNNANCDDCGSEWDSRTAPVASFKPNPYGLYDTVSNVMEWVEDGVDRKVKNYDKAPTDGSATAGNTLTRVVRGSAWFFVSSVTRVSYRSERFKTVRGDTIGFRLAQDL